ncbi:hypothetical protein AAC387_Pa07g0448 [Persea americana]
MESKLRFGVLFEEWKPYLVMSSLAGLLPAVYMILVQSLLSNGINGLVLLVYQHFIATVFLFALAFFFEKGKRPPLTLEILCYSFLLGFLQVTLCQLFLTLSLGFIGATFQSVAMNTNTAVIFVLAVIFKVERLRFWSIHGQAKIWGVVVSAVGSTVMVMWTGPALLPLLTTSKASHDKTIGATMLSLAVLSGASWNLLMGHVGRKYPADLSLSAMMSFFGTIQTAIIAAFFVTRESWHLKLEGGLVLLGIFYGGIAMTGLLSYSLTWCIRKKGSVFTSAFSPLVVVFSFLLETAVLKKRPHLGSIIGGVLVVFGLYLLLWGKANENKKEAKPCKGSDVNESLI